MLSQPLTAGQLRVQQLASQFLEEKEINPQTLHHEGAQGEPIYDEFLARLVKDEVVRCDSLLAERVVDSEVAALYVVWLEATKPGKLDMNQTPVILDFHRMLFNGSCFGDAPSRDYGRKVYEGCSTRTRVTARALLTLASGGTVDSINCNFIDFQYYANSRIINIANGNHRLLACKLLGRNTLGNITLHPAFSVIYDDQPNEPLNRALLYFERMYAGDSYRNNTLSTQYVIGHEALWLKLAAAYERSTETDKRNELYLFTKYDLNKRAVLMPPPTSLDDYVTVYNYLNLPPPPESGTLRLLRLVGLASRPAVNPSLNESQLAILAAWKDWRTNGAVPLEDTPVSAEA